jgi:hypothetical protein
MRWTGHVERRGRRACRILVEKLDGKRPIGRSRTIFEDDIKTYLTKI